MYKDQFDDLTIKTKHLQLCGNCEHDLTDIPEQDKEYDAVRNAADGSPMLINGEPHQFTKIAWKLCPNCGMKNKTHDIRWSMM